MNKKIVRTIIETCLKVRKGERLLIVTDDALFGLAYDLYRTAKSIKKDIDFVIMPQADIHGQEPPETVALAMRSVSAALLMTAKSLSHTKARRIACEKYGVRIASLPGVTREMLMRSVPVDYNKLRKKTDYAAQQLTKGRYVRMTSRSGTDISFSIKGRTGLADDGLYGEKGIFGNLPAGEAYIAPVEGTANGIIVVDGSAPMIGKVSGGKKITVKDGYAARFPYGIIENKVRAIGEKAYNLAEFGIGLNPRAKVTGNTLEDEKALNTIHIAFGNNAFFGGKVYCPCHLDFVVRWPEVFIDGKRLEL